MRKMYLLYVLEVSLNPLFLGIFQNSRRSLKYEDAIKSKTTTIGLHFDLGLAESEKYSDIRTENFRIP